MSDLSYNVDMFMKFGAEMATGSENTHTPWAQIGMNPSNYFDEACIPEGFKFQDPSRMGLSVKELLNHLRKRQEELGVNAFRFHHIMRNQKLEPAEYPPEARKAFEHTEDNQAESDNEQRSPMKSKLPIKSTPKPKRQVKSTPNIVEENPIVNSQNQSIPDIERKFENIKVEGEHSDMPEFSQSLGLPPGSEKPTSSQIDGIAGTPLEKTRQLNQSQPNIIEMARDNPNGVQRPEGLPMAFNFPPDPMYHAYNQQPPQPSVYHSMPVMNGSSVPSWPPQSILQGANFNSQAPTYSGPPYSMGGMMNFYHPQYGPLNYAPSQPYPPVIDPQLQLPPGEPTFNIHKTFMSSEPAPPEAARVMIQPPTYTPTKSSPLKSSPLKRKRPEDNDLVTKTPTTRSGRIVRTPKKS